MTKFHLSKCLKIEGISSASGIVYIENSLFIISDNSSFLYQFEIDSKVLTLHQLLKKSKENISKKEKPDFESIVKQGDNILILGSGSTEKRTNSILIKLETELTKIIDNKKLFEKFVLKAAIKSNELNIEGFIVFQDKQLYFQRGNGASSKNGIFIVSRTDEIEFKNVSLPKINSIEASFTDAVLVEDDIYFLAAVENTKSTYYDGEILGTFLGKINTTDFSIEKTILLSKTNKFEGITLYKQNHNTTEFFLCEDNDTDNLECFIYNLKISK